MKQYEAVILTLEKLGGVATLGELNHEVFKIEDCEWKTKTPFASIRRIVQQNKEIYNIKPGLYGLMKYKKENKKETKQKIVINKIRGIYTDSSYFYEVKKERVWKIHTL